MYGAPSLRRSPDLLLVVLIGVSVAFHALVFWWFAADFHASGTGAVRIVLAPGLVGDPVAVPQPPVPLASAVPLVKENQALPETAPDVWSNHANQDMALPGALPPQAPVVKWKGGAVKSASGHKASADKAFNSADLSRGSGGNADLKNTYLAMVRQRIAKMRKYPVTAKMRHLEGLVVVRFSIRADGRAEAVRIASGSGVNSLDNAALAAVISASPFPSLPQGLRGKRLELDVPIRFEMVTY